MCLCCFSCLIASKCFEYCTSFRMHPPLQSVEFQEKINRNSLYALPKKHHGTVHDAGGVMSRVPTSVDYQGAPLAISHFPPGKGKPWHGIIESSYRNGSIIHLGRMRMKSTPTLEFIPLERERWWVLQLSGS